MEEFNSYIYLFILRERQLGRSRCRWEDNIKIGLQEFGYGGYGLD
jgi:hypothetical protein